MPSRAPAPDTVRSYRRAAAYKSWAYTPDRTERTAPARAAALARFERAVDPDGVLDPAERARRAESLRRAYFVELGIRSGQARRAKRSSR